MNRRILHKTASAVWVRGSAASWTGYRGLLAALRVSFSGGQLPPSQEVCPHLLREQATEIMIQGLHVPSVLVPRCANKTCAEIHGQAASMTLNSKYKSLPLPLCLFPLLLS